MRENVKTPAGLDHLTARSYEMFGLSEETLTRGSYVRVYPACYHHVVSLDIKAALTKRG